MLGATFYLTKVDQNSSESFKEFDSDSQGKNQCFIIINSAMIITILVITPAVTPNIQRARFSPNATCFLFAFATLAAFGFFVDFFVGFFHERSTQVPHD